MQMFVLLLCPAVALRFEADLVPSFQSFVEKEHRRYVPGSPEFAQRQKLYEDRVQRAQLQNKNPDRLWTAGPNEFWDWTQAELASLFPRGEYKERLHERNASKLPKHGFLQSKNNTRLQSINITQSNFTPANLPAEVHWEEQLKTLEIARNQGACGSCWAVSAVTTLEATVELQRGYEPYRPISVQNLVDCVPNPQECGGQGGCRGATVDLALQHILDHGTPLESEVPYRAVEYDCPYTTNFHVANHALAPGSTVTGNTAASFGFTGYEILEKNNYGKLLEALAYRPVAVSVTASGWVDYSYGIFDGCPKWDSIIDHAVVATGYGVTMSGVKYWTIQNSWGPYWGESGRIRLLRQDNDGSNCGINDQPELGTGCLGGPPTVPVCGMCGVLFESVVADVVPNAWPA